MTTVIPNGCSLGRPSTPRHEKGLLSFSQIATCMFFVFFGGGVGVEVKHTAFGPFFFNFWGRVKVMALSDTIYTIYVGCLRKVIR